MTTLRLLRGYEKVFQICFSILIWLLLGRGEAWVLPSAVLPHSTRKPLLRHQPRFGDTPSTQSPPMIKAQGNQLLYSLGSSEQQDDAYGGNVENWIMKVRVRLVAGLSSKEWAFLQALLELAASEFLTVTLAQQQHNHQPPTMIVGPIQSDKYHGTTGRVLMLESSFVNDHPDKANNNQLTDINQQQIRQGVQENFCSHLRDLIDVTLYSSDPAEKRLKDPILVSFLDENTNESNVVLTDVARNWIEETIEIYDIARPLTTVPTPMPSDKHFKPTQVIEVDGAFVQEPLHEEPQWDTSLVAVFDNLVTNDLRKRLLSLIGGSDGDLEADTTKWVAGALRDVMDEDDEADTTISSGLGLTTDAIEELCMEGAHDAIEEMQSIWTELFPDFHVTRLSPAVMGEQVSPLAANAPMHGNSFRVHIDGDPAFTPPSPWSDIFGRYPNRSAGKPRFVTFLVYLNGEWKNQEENDEDWGASTLFWDVATETEFHITPKPGRCLLMDQDVSHSVSAPWSEEVGPRYSLVWKLILHPRREIQDMRDLSCGRTWEDSTLLGSAAGTTG